MLQRTRLAILETLAGHARQRGSLLILAVVTLVMIALMGLAFLQQAKMDRFGTDRYERDYMDLVINGTLAEIRTQLHEDVFENRFSRHGLSDYPWTETTLNWEVTDGSGTVRTAAGDFNDDRYLASTIPIVTGSGATDATWPHLTNLGGFWLDLPAIGSSQTEPRETLIDFSTAEASTTDITVAFLNAVFSGDYVERGIDADGDGVLDSRWTWAPPAVRDFGGLRYVIAGRAVDLSSMININVATSNVDNTGLIPNAITSLGPNGTLGRGYTPVDIDLGQLFDRTTVSDAEWEADLNNIFFNGPRALGLPATWTWPFTQAQREEIWRNQAFLYGYNDNRYLMADEAELRHSGGLNNDENLANVEDASLGAYFVTRNDSMPLPAEGTYGDVAGVSDLHDWFTGGDPGTTTVDNRTFPAIRHMLTGISGHSVYAPDYGGAGGLSPSGPIGRLKYDLNDGNTLNPTDPVYLGLTQKIRSTFLHPNNPANPDTENYLGLTDDEITNQVAPDFALAIMDYADDDYIPTGRTVNGVQRYGLERLPFFREVYAQVIYEERDVADVGGDGEDTTAPPGFYDTWKPLDGGTAGAGSGASNSSADTRAVAIELGNPFPQDIEGAKLNNNVRLVIDGGSTWVFSSFPDIPGRDDNSADADRVILWSPPTDSVSATGGGNEDGKSLDTDLGFNGAPRVLQLGDGDLVFACNGQPIVFELQVEADLNGVATWVTYDRIQISGFSASNTVNPLTTNNDQDRSMAQSSGYRDSERINYVVEHNSLGGSQTGPAPGGDSFTDISEFNKDLKNQFTATPAITLPNAFQLLHADRSPSDGDGYYSVAELGLTPMFGFTDHPTNGTFPRRLALLGVSRLFLDFSENPEVPTYGPPSLASGIPHAAMLMDQFTTVSPRYDGLDNDDDDGDKAPGTGADNPEEQFVPGTININTAPLHILTLAAPMPDSSLDDVEELMRSIIEYRDDRFPFTSDERNNSPVQRTTPGIASLGELMYIRGSTGGNQPSDMQYYANDGAVLGAAFDIHPKPEDSGYDVTRFNAPANDGVLATYDSPEEALARFQMLSQAFTVRSDVFVVYLRVRAYVNGAFNAGPVDEAAVVAIIDRSQMVRDGSDEPLNAPRIIGYKRLK